MNLLLPLKLRSLMRDTTALLNVLAFTEPTILSVDTSTWRSCRGRTILIHSSRMSRMPRMPRMHRMARELGILVTSTHLPTISFVDSALSESQRYTTRRRIVVRHRRRKSMLGLNTETIRPNVSRRHVWLAGISKTRGVHFRETKWLGG